jgi:uncharacterized membrane protein YfhO
MKPCTTKKYRIHNTKRSLDQAFLVLIPGLLVIAILAITYKMNNLFPFGPNTIAWCDMNQQVVPIMLQFRNILTSGESIFFHMGNAGGANFWGIFFFFLSSPFSLLILFFQKSSIFEVMNILAALKMALAGITAMIAFRKILTDIKTIPAVILSVLYALCGFSLMFFQILGWLDVFYLFPLLALGLYKLLVYREFLLYIVILSLVILMNYYLSFIVLLFIIFVSFLFWLTRKTNTPIPSLRPAGSELALLSYSTLLCGFSTAVIWLPSLIQYLNSARTISVFESLQRGTFFGPYETKISTLLVSSLLLLIIPLVFLHIKKIFPPVSWLSIFLMMLVPITVEPINKMWHTGNYQAFPARYSFIIVFIGLLIVGYYFSKSNYFNLENDEMDSNRITLKSRFFYTLLCSAFAFPIGIFALYLMTERKELLYAYTKTLWADETSFLYLLLTFLLFGAAYSLLIVLRHFRKISANVLIVILTFLILSELLFNTGVYLGYPSSSPAKYDAIFDLEQHIPDSRHSSGNADQTIYRVKAHEKYFDVNLLGGLGVPTLNTYTSLTSADYMASMKKLGYSSYWMEVSSSQGSLFSDRLMANRYEIVSFQDQKRLASGKEILYQNDHYAISNDPLTLGIALLIDSDSLQPIREIPDADRFTIQNILFHAITGSDVDLFTFYSSTGHHNVWIEQNEKIDLRKTDAGQPAYLEYHIDIDERQILYFDCFDKVSGRLVEPINDSIRISVNDKILQNSYPNKKTNGLLKLGEFENETVYIKIELNKNVRAQSFGVAGLNMQLLDQEFARINDNNPIQSIRQNKNRIEILLDNTYMNSAIPDSAYHGEDHLLLTVSYEGTVIAKADDHLNIPVEQAFGSWITVRIPSGASRVTFYFYPRGITPSLIASFLSILIGIVLWRKQSFFQKFRVVRYAIKAIPVVFLIFSVLVFALVYLFPVIYKLYSVF